MRPEFIGELDDLRSGVLLGVDAETRVKGSKE
jgi:hypothetical protein